MSKKIFVLDSNLDIKEIKKSNHCYIIAKNGIFFKDNQNNIETCIKIDSIEGLSSLEPYIKWKFPKISKRQFDMVVSFFKKIHTKYKSECMVLIGWDRKNKKIVIFAPTKQIVTGASIKYDIGDIPKGVAVIGSIHSHSSMSAFHSGVDIADEMNFDGLHITLGKFSDKSNTFQISSQLTAGKMREDIEFTKIIENIDINYNVKLKSFNLKDCSVDKLVDAIRNNQCDIEYETELYFNEKSLSKNDISIIGEWEKTVSSTKFYNYSGYNAGYKHNQIAQFQNQNKFDPNKSKHNMNNMINQKDQEEIDLALMYGVDDPDDLLIYEDMYELNDSILEVETNLSKSSIKV